MRVRRRFTVKEIVDLTLPLLPHKTKIQVPSFIQWVDQVKQDNKHLPRVRIYRSKNAKSQSIISVAEAIPTKAASDAAQD
jgi:hypothetical protein